MALGDAEVERLVPVRPQPVACRGVVVLPARQAEGEERLRGQQVLPGPHPHLQVHVGGLVLHQRHRVTRRNLWGGAARGHGKRLWSSRILDPMMLSHTQSQPSHAQSHSLATGRHTEISVPENAKIGQKRPEIIKKKYSKISTGDHE